MIRFQIPETSTISISIFNILGQKVASVLNKNISAGVHNIHWNGRDDFGHHLPSGLYFYALENNSGMKQMKKLMILK
jgi:flagellar hook assembly protein FlgD